MKVKVAKFIPLKYASKMYILKETPTFLYFFFFNYSPQKRLTAVIIVRGKVVIQSIFLFKSRKI